jgi:hypothetical protein
MPGVNEELTGRTRETAIFPPELSRFVTSHQNGLRLVWPIFFQSTIEDIALGIGRHKITFLNTGWQKFRETFAYHSVWQPLEWIFRFFHPQIFEFKPFFVRLKDSSDVSEKRCTDPELAHIGLTEKEATVHGLEFRVLQVAITPLTIPRARTIGQMDGLLKATIEKSTQRILGCTILAAEAGETLLAGAGIPLERIE